MVGWTEVPNKTVQRHRKERAEVNLHDGTEVQANEARHGWDLGMSLYFAECKACLHVSHSF